MGQGYSSNADGDVVKEETFKAFGEELISSGNYTDNHRFTGKEFENSDVYYFGARYYDPLLGRFLNPDPANSFKQENPLTANPFTYCLNNPLKYIDADGMRAMFKKELEKLYQIIDHARINSKKSDEIDVQLECITPVSIEELPMDLTEAPNSFKWELNVKKILSEVGLLNDPTYPTDDVNLFVVSKDIKIKVSTGAGNAISFILWEDPKSVSWGVVKFLGPTVYMPHSDGYYYDNAELIRIEVNPEIWDTFIEEFKKGTPYGESENKERGTVND